VDSFAAELLQALLALLAVCVLAVLILRTISKRGFGLPQQRGPVRVVQRIILEPRRSLYLIQAGSRVLLVGMSENGSPVLLAELSEEILSDTITTNHQPKSFGEVLRSFIKNKGNKGS